MRRVLKVRFIVPVLIAGYFIWICWPFAPDHAERTDICSSSSVSNERFRDFISEAKAMMSTHQGDLVMRSANSMKIGPQSAALNALFATYIKRSGSVEELVFRLHAFGRALDGRTLIRFDPSPVLEDRTHYPGSSGLWEIENMALPDSRQYFVVGQEFQAPQKIASHDWWSWAWARVLGQRYETLRIGLAFETGQRFPISPENLIKLYLPGASAGVAVARPEIDLMNDARVGDRRVQNQCPDVATILANINFRLAKGKN